MPKAGRLWRHVIINTRGSWLHGDARGFRSRGHRIHSSGDYRHRPPVGEHEGLGVFNEMHSREEVHIPYEQRAVVGRTIAKCFLDNGYRILAVAVTKVHAHFLVELPGTMSEVKRLVGDAKRVSSRAVKEQLPGSVWSSGWESQRDVCAKTPATEMTNSRTEIRGGATLCPGSGCAVFCFPSGHPLVARHFKFEREF